MRHDGLTHRLHTIGTCHQRQVTQRDAPPGIPACDRMAPRRHLRAQPLIGVESLDRRNPGIRIIRPCVKHAIGTHFGQAGRIRRDDRAAACHGLDRRQAEPLDPRGKQEAERRAEHQGEVVVADTPKRVQVRRTRPEPCLSRGTQRTSDINVKPQRVERRGNAPDQSGILVRLILAETENERPDTDRAV